MYLKKEIKIYQFISLIYTIHTILLLSKIIQYAKLINTSDLNGRKAFKKHNTYFNLLCS